MGPKIILGTANFHNTYGLSKKKIADISELKKIINIANKNNIDEVDTAFSYGVERKLKYLSNKKWKINTKIPTLNLNKDIKNNIFSMVKNSLKYLKKKNFESIFLHDPSQIHNKKGEEILKSLIELKKFGYTKKIGFAVYNPEELKKLIKSFRPDLVQVPLSIADRRFKDNGLLNNLKKLKIKVQARSIFLQGLLTLKANDRPQYFNLWKNTFSEWDRYILVNKYDRIKVCLDFISSIKEIDKFIVGFNTSIELNEIINNLKKKKIKKFFRFKNLNSKILIPLNWKI
jgi:aryl-alcohol dehydrogenase-like predicted oxidoreductase